jgi:16S rRNA (guanine966-N2)-methyltransferase
VSRIIAGVAGGRRIVTPPGASTRPTSDRAREGLFSTLTSLRGSLDGAAFLDLYAGSGAVGLEALSRGAATVVLVERGSRAIAALRANVDALGLAGAQITADAVERFLAGRASRSFDVVFADPPYAEDIEDLLTRITRGGWLADGAVIVVERASRGPEPGWPAGVEAIRSRRYGEATLWYGRRS